MKNKDYLYKLYYRKGSTALCIKKFKHQKTLEAISSHWGQIWKNYSQETAKRNEKYKGRFFEGTAPREDEVSTYFIKDEEWLVITKELGLPIDKTLVVYVGSSNRPFFKYKLKKEEE